jgi:hypothetical protein
MTYERRWWRTNPTEQSPSGEANGSSVNEEIPCSLWNAKGHYRVQKSPLLVLSCARWIQSTSPRLISFKTHFNIILSSTPMSSKWSFLNVIRLTRQFCITPHVWKVVSPTTLHWTGKYAGIQYERLRSGSYKSLVVFFSVIAQASWSGLNSWERRAGMMSVVGILTRLRTGRARKRGFISGRSKKFIYSPDRPEWLCPPPPRSPICTGVPSPETDQLPPHIAEVKNKWSCTPIFPYAFMALHRDNFKFYFLPLLLGT